MKDERQRERERERLRKRTAGERSSARRKLRRVDKRRDDPVREEVSCRVNDKTTSLEGRRGKGNFYVA